MKSLVHVRLPRAGLGNKLLVWARAKVFGTLNNLAIVTTGWSDIKIGPMFRRERFKRLYFGYFKSENPLQLLNLIYSYAVCERIVEPSLQAQISPSDNSLYIFKEIPCPNYFDCIRDHRDLIRSAFFSMVSRAILNKVLKNKPPVIGVHIRRSDFTQDIRTPGKYFIDAIKLVRHIHGENLPVTIFSDAYPNELYDVMAVGNVVISTSTSALYDLISFSRSHCLILSDHSTFGYWAGFLADAPIILPNSPYFQIRNLITNMQYYEGVVKEDPLLIKNIREIHF